MASFTGAELLEMVRAETLHDADTQVTDNMIYRRIGVEYPRIRRWLAEQAPDLCKDSDTVTVAAGASVILKSALSPTVADTVYEHISCIERVIDTNVRRKLNLIVTAHDRLAETFMSFVEYPTEFRLYPEEDAPGSYVVTYVTGVTQGTGTASDATRAHLLPFGIEQALVSRVAAWVKQRLDDDFKYHLANADDVLKESARMLRMRHGSHSPEGLD